MYVTLPLVLAHSRACKACSEERRGTFTNTRRKVPTIGTQLDYGMSGIHGGKKGEMIFTSGSFN